MYSIATLAQQILAFKLVVLGGISSNQLEEFFIELMEFKKEFEDKKKAA